MSSFQPCLCSQSKDNSQFGWCLSISPRLCLCLVHWISTKQTNCGCVTAAATDHQHCLLCSHDIKGKARVETLTQTWGNGAYPARRHPAALDSPHSHPTCLHISNQLITHPLTGCYYCLSCKNHGEKHDPRSDVAPVQQHTREAIRVFLQGLCLLGLQSPLLSW